jgi:diacylglycerol kinase
MKQKTGRSFINAITGLGYFFRHENNGRIQSAIGIGVLAMAVFLRISTMEWLAVLICIGSVLSLEMLNSALEKLCDLVQPGFHPQIKIIKDLAAGAVLWASVLSALIGTVIFLPKILAFL